VTLVLLHPLPLDGSIWAAETRALAPRSIAPTLYDLGGSLEEWADGVIDLCGPGPLVLVGNSIGGSCAIEVARRVPDRVRSMVLIGTKAGHRPEPDLRDEALRVLEQHGMAGAWPRYWAPLFAPDADGDIVELARSVAHAQRVDAVINGVRVFHSRPDRAEFLGTLDVPIVVVSGEHDVAARNGAALAAGLRHGQFRRVDGAGHYVPMERPDALTEIVRPAIDRSASHP
jgi:pimeloyl-ACP methyl ester carboxylesterase